MHSDCNFQTLIGQQIVFVTILDTIVFHTIPSFLSILGTLIILSSALYVAVSGSFIWTLSVTEVAIIKSSTSQRILQRRQKAKTHHWKRVFWRMRKNHLMRSKCRNHRRSSRPVYRYLVIGAINRHMILLYRLACVNRGLKACFGISIVTFNLNYVC